MQLFFNLHKAFVIFTTQTAVNPQFCTFLEIVIIFLSSNPFKEVRLLHPLNVVFLIRKEVKRKAYS